ncbi:MAG: hypothetical protein Q8P67_19655 [archaeon]|nr:hypothetical protein [archaeon]
MKVAGDADILHYETLTSVHDVAAGPGAPDLLQSGDAELVVLVGDVLTSNSAHDTNALDAWEEQITECTHTLSLEQAADAPHIAEKRLAHCGSCELSSNLWLYVCFFFFFISFIFHSFPLLL